MAVKPSAAVAAAAATLALLAFAAPAQAELQTWRLMATTQEVSEGFTAPAFAAIGNTFTVDYVIDTQTPSNLDWEGSFDDAVKSVTINGVTSVPTGTIVASEGGVNGIHIWTNEIRADNIDFIAFNVLHDFTLTDITSTLELFQVLVQVGWTNLRVDFGSDHILAQPMSFAMTSSVPEPSAAWLLLMGLPCLALKRSRAA